MKFCIILCILIFSSIAVAFNDKVYQMDLFSLISFGLAIGAFALSVFMAWLSWKFYEKSSEDSRKTQDSVVKIETAVLGIQSNITEIVRQAVNQWTTGSSVNNGLYEKIEHLSQLLGEKEPNLAELQNVAGSLEKLVEQNEESLIEMKAKSIFPSIDTGLSARSGAVSQFSQNIEINNEEEKSGKLYIEILRESKIATITGKFEPAFGEIPKDFNYELISVPSGNKEDISIYGGVGKEFDFNIHLRSKRSKLPLGFYVVKYIAKQ